MSKFDTKPLPEGWRRARLTGPDGIADIVNGSTPSSTEARFWDGEILWVTPSDLGKLDDIYLWDTERKITDEGYKSCSTQLVPKGTVLLTSRAPVGSIAIAGKELCTNQGFKNLMPRKVVDSLYLYFAIRSLVPAIQKKAHGNTFDEITKEALSVFVIPLPPTKKEQEEIARTVESKLNRIKGMRRAAEMQLNAMIAFEFSLLRDSFEKPKAGDWKPLKLGDLADVVMGQSPDGSTYNKVGKGLPLLNGPTEFTEDHPLPVQWTTSPKKVCNPKDLLLCVRGNTTGRMNWADQVYALGRGVAAVRGKEGKGHTPFIRHAIRYELNKLLIGSERSTFPNIGKDDIAEFQFYAPSAIEEQEKFAFELDRKLVTRKEIAGALERQKEAISALPAATLREFFNFGSADGS